MISSTLPTAAPFSSRAMSPTAEYVAALTSSTRQHLQTSSYFGLATRDVFDELHNLCDQCKEPHWDGYSAEPIADDTYDYAYRFLEALPLGVPKPSVGAEPDGHITFEWHRSPRRTLSISISPSGDLHYAALHGLSKPYGSEPFFGEIPQIILDLISRVNAP
jgi:hypothetical protein